MDDRPASRMGQKSGRVRPGQVVRLALIVCVFLAVPAAGRAQEDDFWDEPFAEPLYLVHITETGTPSGPVEKDDYILYPQQPEDGVLLTADGYGGYFINKAETAGGPFATRRQVCSASQGIPPEKLALGFSCTGLPEVQECVDACRQYHGPHGLGEIVDGACSCRCEDGYEEDSSLVCVPTQAQCDRDCREYHGTDKVHGLEAYGKVVDGVCNCSCAKGYVPDETLTCVKEKSCQEDCQAQWGAQVEGRGTFPNCACTCTQGYEKSATSHKCETSCAAQCKKQYGLLASGNGDPALPCDCFCLYPYQWNAKKTECVRRSRYIDDARDLERFLRTRGYNEANCPASGPLPAGSVKFWNLGTGVNAHTSTVLSKNRQIEMGGARDAAGNPIAAIIQPSSNNPQADPRPNVGSYSLHKVLCPPADSYVDEKGIEKLAGTPRYGEKDKDATDDWNCHGFSGTVADRFVETFVRVQPNTNVNWDQALEIGALHGFKPATIQIRQGQVRFHSEYTIEVGADGTATIYLMEGRAEYEGSGHSVSLSSGQMAVIDGAGVPSAPARFDPEGVDRWWVEMGAVPSSGGLGLGGGWGMAAALIGLPALVLAGGLLLAWQFSRRHRARPARVGREQTVRQKTPVALPAQAWGRLSLCRGGVPVETLRLERPTLMIGRSASNDLVLTDRMLSRQHAQIVRQGEAALIQDLGSTNGTFVNDERVWSSRVLRPGDVIHLGQTELRFGPPQTFAGRLVIKQGQGDPAILSLAGRREVAIGRSQGNDLVIRDDAHVSRQHALVRWTPGGHEVVDLGSGSGVAVNGRQVSRALLQPGDCIRLGATELLYRY